MSFDLNKINFEESIDLPLTKDQILTLQEMKPMRWYYCNEFTEFMRSLEKLGLVEHGENPIRLHPAWRITIAGINAAKFDRGWIDRQ
jgi:hypothetical protein